VIKLGASTRRPSLERPWLDRLPDRVKERVQTKRYIDFLRLTRNGKRRREQMSASEQAEFDALRVTPEVLRRWRDLPGLSGSLAVAMGGSDGSFRDLRCPGKGYDRSSSSRCLSTASSSSARTARSTAS
jgi:hypothetical protein